MTHGTKADTSCVQLPSQLSTPGGAFACTSIAWHWVVAVLENLVPARCSCAQYDIISASAVSAHQLLRHKLSAPGFLNCAELAEYFEERHLRIAEFGIYSADIDLEECMRRHAMHVDTVHSLIASPAEWTYALLITHNEHTTALVSTADSVVLLDSLPATMHELRRTDLGFQKELKECLARVLPSRGAEGTAMLVRK